jgi:CRP-like cAMP-binding protein
MKRALMSLGETDFVAGLPPAETRELLAMSEMRTYRDGEPAFSQGDAMPGLLVVVEGGLKVFQTDRRGKVQVLEFLHSGDCAGVDEAFDEGVAASGAQALGRTRCRLVPPLPLRLLAARNPTVATWASQHLAARTRRLISLVETLSLHSVAERVAQLILEHQGGIPERLLVEFRENQENSSQRIGASREGFSRALRLLADLGLIKNMFPVVRIVDVQKLRCYVGGMGRPDPIHAVGRPPLVALRPLASRESFMPRRHAMGGV